ncbi:MAG TPA: HGxxPAAW family protein [Streptosporangiaceae bacterium]|nr:HGxxPAAW family protein [Streptosporangiaceae bacterium]
MANQVEPGTIGGAAAEGATDQGAVATHGGPASAGTVAHGRPAAHAGPHPSFHGRTVSWIAVAIMMVGFLVGGLALIFGHHGPIWWLFWVGTGLAALGLLVSVATNTFEDWY